MNKKTYSALRKAGFLRFEAFEFARETRLVEGKRIRVSSLPLTTPYIKAMIRERAKTYRQAKRLGFDEAEWQATILEEMYDVRDWLDDEGNPDPWQMLRHNELRWRYYHPEYESPSRKKPRKRVDFVSKYARGLEAYEKGRGR